MQCGAVIKGLELGFNSISHLNEVKYHYVQDTGFVWSLVFVFKAQKHQLAWKQCYVVLGSLKVTVY